MAYSTQYHQREMEHLKVLGPIDDSLTASISRPETYGTLAHINRFSSVSFSTNESHGVASLDRIIKLVIPSHLLTLKFDDPNSLDCDVVDEDKFVLTKRGKTAPAETLLEHEYRKLGNISGECATSEGRAKVRAFWIKEVKTIEWLIQRAKDETDVDVLSSISDILADAGYKAIKPILECLEGEPKSELAACLLSAIEWIEIPDRPILIDRLKGVLARYLNHQDYDVREKACWASRALPASQALSICQVPQDCEPSCERDGDGTFASF
jgi:hypothetical protein